VILINLLKAICGRLFMTGRYLLDNEYSKKKTKEEMEKDWQGFKKEQEKAFDELLIEKGIKKQETIKIGNT
jgi:hypothetical protein